MRPTAIIVSALTLLAMGVITRPTAAAWPHDPYNGNLVVSGATSEQSNAVIVPDGAGGTLVAWIDRRTGNYDIYLQRISATGAPLWTADGVRASTTSANEYRPAVVADGTGGAIVVWEDYRAGAYDLYAQRLSAAGAIQWTSGGVALCTATGNQNWPAGIADGAGGAIVTWYDTRSGATEDIYAQRISASGTVQWTANGVPLCTAANNQREPAITTDGSGGAIVAWYDNRTAGFDVYAQRISGAGVVQWTTNGVALSAAANDQVYTSIVSDGDGGAIATWNDLRSGSNYDIYAQRISAAGSPLWTADGVALCTAANSQIFSGITTDGAGGAIVSWQDYRGGSNYDIYAQRINAAGLVAWTADGVALCTAAAEQAEPKIVSDDAGGAIVTWRDFRDGSQDIYAQRVSSLGATQWTWNGVALCAAVRDQTLPAISRDDAGGAVVAWRDTRISGSTGDLYAQRVDRYGKLGNAEPAITRVQDLPNDQGGFVKVSWDASYLDAEPFFNIYEYRLFRSAAGPLAPGAALQRAVTEDSDIAVRDGALLATATAGATVYWEYVATQLAEGFAGYSRVVATTADSVAGGNPRTWFMVEARSSSSQSAQRWASAPDSGYSVDNLAPAMPAPLTGQYAAGTTALHWDRNREVDLAGYRLYRGSTAGFVPGPGNLVAALPDTGYADAAGAPYVYKLTAVDTHGNESPVATLVPSGTTGVDGPAPPALAFAAPGPNPARGEVRLRFTLSRPGTVRLAVFDAAGRRVQVLRDGELPAGEHTAGFVLRDEAGRALPSGLYLLRLEAEGRVLTRRLAAVR